MEKIKLTQVQYEQMLINDEDYKVLSLEQLEEKVNQGAELVEKNKGFYGLENKLSEDEMIDAGAFIDYRTAKRDLGEFVEEIDD